MWFRATTTNIEVINLEKQNERKHVTLKKDSWTVKSPVVSLRTRAQRARLKGHLKRTGRRTKLWIAVVAICVCVSLTSLALSLVLKLDRRKETTESIVVSRTNESKS